jgi:hypothetical protein
MEDKDRIEALGGTSAVAKALNKRLRKIEPRITRARVHNWKIFNRIPPYWALRFKAYWATAEKDKDKPSA